MALSSSAAPRRSLGAPSQAKDVDSMAARIKEVFAIYDRNGDHILDSGEFRNALEHLGIWPEEIPAIAREVDYSRDGNISVKEFVAWIKGGSERSLGVARAIERTTGGALIARIKQTFEMYDKSG